MPKRIYDIFFSFAGLVMLFPVFVVIGAMVRIWDGGPVFFRQERVGQHGRLFRILKFRTMTAGAEKMGGSITRRGDGRVTAPGRVLRRAKLDELPQLWNVLKGEMSLVGPRPEVPKYTAIYSDEQRKVLELKPGITDLASLAFRNEEELLAQAEDVELFYVKHCIPAKIDLNLRYSRRANLWEDTLVIFRTLFGAKWPIWSTYVEQFKR